MNNKLLIVLIIIFSLLLIGILLVVFVFSGATNVIPPSICSCDVDLNCDDFTTQQQAQACFEHCMEQGLEDVHGLDNDGDGIVCESLS